MTTRVTDGNKKGRKNKKQKKEGKKDTEEEKERRKEERKKGEGREGRKNENRKKCFANLISGVFSPTAWSGRRETLGMSLVFCTYYLLHNAVSTCHSYLSYAYNSHFVMGSCSLFANLLHQLFLYSCHNNQDAMSPVRLQNELSQLSISQSQCTAFDYSLVNYLPKNLYSDKKVPENRKVQKGRTIVPDALNIREETF